MSGCDLNVFLFLFFFNGKHFLIVNVLTTDFNILANCGELIITTKIQP